MTPGTLSLNAPLRNDSETERIEFLSTEAESVEDQVSKKEIKALLHNKISEFRHKMSPGARSRSSGFGSLLTTLSRDEKSANVTGYPENEFGRSK